jgi:hypothetical protein
MIRWFLSLVILGGVSTGALAADPEAAPTKWPAGKIYRLKEGLEVTVSAPVLVGRSTRTHYWYPGLARLANGDLIAHVTTSVDGFGDKGKEPGEVVWSSDGGLTWGNPQEILYASASKVLLPNGDLLFLPYRLYPYKDGVSGPCQLVPAGKREVRHLHDRTTITVTDWPRLLAASEDQKKEGQAGFTIDGQVIQVDKGKKYLVTIDGYFRQTDKPFRWSKTVDGTQEVKTSVVAAESEDGYHWKIRSVIADDRCKLRGYEGPNEATLCRLSDNRLMSLFRMEGYGPDIAPNGQSFSRDEGKTWTEPVAVDAPIRSTYPRTTVFKNGVVALSIGRPGLDLWLNANGSGKGWQTVDILEHHNLFRPKERIPRWEGSGHQNQGRSTGTTDMVLTDSKDGATVLFIYDRSPLEASVGAMGAKDGPPIQDKAEKDPAYTYSTWVVRATIKKYGR